MNINSKPLRIAHFTDTFCPKIDGVVTFLDNSITFLSKRNHKIAVFCPKYNKEKEKYFRKNVEIFRLRSVPLHTYRDVKISLARPKKIFRSLKKFNPDLIHIHTPGPIGLLGTLASRKLNVPLIGTYHTLVSEQIHYISFGNMLGLNKVAEKINNILKRERPIRNLKDNSLLKKLIWKLSLKIFDKCHVIIAPSQSIANLLRSKLKRDIAYVCSGINIKKFRPKKSYKQAKILSFLHVGRLSFEKDIDIVIKAFHILARKDGIDFSLYIVGDGPARKYLERMVKSYGMESKIHFMGKVSESILKQMYKRCDVFVTASAMETLGMVILEALASGTPVIAVRKYASPDIVKEGVNGYLAKPYDPISLAKAIKKIIKNKSNIPLFGRKGVKIAQKCEFEKNMKKLESIYINTVRLHTTKN